MWMPWNANTKWQKRIINYTFDYILESTHNLIESHSRALVRTIFDGVNAFKWQSEFMHSLIHWHQITSSPHVLHNSNGVRWYWRNICVCVFVCSNKRKKFCDNDAHCFLRSTHDAFLHSSWCFVQCRYMCAFVYVPAGTRIPSTQFGTKCLLSPRSQRTKACGVDCESFNGNGHMFNCEIETAYEYIFVTIKSNPAHPRTGAKPIFIRFRIFSNRKLVIDISPSMPHSFAANLN